MKRVLKFTGLTAAAVLGSVLSAVTLFIVGLAAFMIIPGVAGRIELGAIKTGITKDGYLRIVGSGTGSQGFQPQYDITDTDVIKCVRDVNDGSIGEYKEGWDFEAVAPGTSMIIYQKYVGGGDFDYAELYKVTVNEQLEISYEKHTAQSRPLAYDLLTGKHRGAYSGFSVERVTVEKDGDTLYDETYADEELEAALRDVYGTSESAPPPTDDELNSMTKLTVTYRGIDASDMEYTNDAVFYFDEGAVYTEYYEYMDFHEGGSSWIKYTLDEWCDTYTPENE